MPQDPLQIALEHHRAGRLRQAEVAYRAALESDPANPDALHWLGVLTFQAGRPDQAVPLLERAAGARPTDAAFQHNLALAYLACRRTGEAIAALERAAALEPGRVQTLAALGEALLARKSPGDAGAAAAALTRARSGGLESPQLLHHLALAHRLRGDAATSRACLQAALQREPAFARALHGLAVLEAEAERLEESAELFRRAVAARPDYAAAYQGLAQVLRRAGRDDEAKAALAEAARVARLTRQRPASAADAERSLTGAPVADLHYNLATLAEVFPPARVPESAVAGLFDRYAEHFDEDLRGRLGYRVPELIAEALARELSAVTSPARPPDVLDLGCGTGLCGPPLRPLAGTLAGVDLSAAMIERAKARGVYDRLAVGEMVAFMRAAARIYDVLVAADVLIYVGDLAPAFEAAAASLRPGGLFAFSVEAAGAECERYELNRRTRRFAHAGPYLRRLAAMYGFEVRSLEPIVVRADAGRDVPGSLAVVRLASGG